MNLLFQLSYLNSNFVPTLGYLNPALNNPALVSGCFELAKTEYIHHHNNAAAHMHWKICKEFGVEVSMNPKLSPRRIQYVAQYPDTSV